MRGQGGNEHGGSSWFKGAETGTQLESITNCVPVSSLRTVGYGHLYQGRFKSFPVQSDDHLLTVLRYIERNAVGAGLVARAEHWRWSGLWARMHGEDAIKAILSPWPVERPVDWTDRGNAPLSAKEFGRVRASIERGRRFGEDEWVKRSVTESLCRFVT